MEYRKREGFPERTEGSSTKYQFELTANLESLTQASPISAVVFQMAPSIHSHYVFVISSHTFKLKAQTVNADDGDLCDQCEF